MVVLLPCSCLNVTVHLTGAPRHVDIHASNTDPAWQALISETSWPSATRGMLSIGGVSVQHEELLSVRTTKGWTVYGCVNCGCDVYATLLQDKSFVALNPMLKICTGRQQQQQQDTLTTRFSPVFHVMVEADPPPLSEGQGPPLGDAHSAEIFAQLQSSVQKYYEEEQRQMTARIAAYVEQEEKQLERLRAQALRDRDALWSRIRAHALLQQRRRTSSGGAQQLISPQMGQVAVEASLGTSTEVSPGIDMQTTPALPSSDASAVQTPPSPAAVAASPASVAPTRPSVVVAQTPLGPETEDDRHRVFSFDEEIPAALFQSPSLGPQEVAAVNAALAMSTTEAEDDDEVNVRGYSGSQTSSGATTPTPMEAITLDDIAPTDQPAVGRPRRMGRVPPPPADEAFAGFSMHDMPARPRMYSASLPMSVPPTPTRMRTGTAQQTTKPIALGVVPAEAPNAAATIAAVDALAQRAEAATFDQPPPGDMSRSFAVPVSSSRKLRAIYF